MRFRVQLVVETENGDPDTVHEIATLERGALRPEDLGLQLAEARDVLRGLQQAVVTEQTARFAEQHACCAMCGGHRGRKGQHQIVWRTPFGKLRVSSPRYYRCACAKAGDKSESPLAEVLVERVAPELAYLENKFAALMSYGLTVAVLAEVLPIGDRINTTAVRRQVRKSAERMESELGEERASFIEGCQRDWDKLPRPDPPLTVGLDGGFVHSCEQTSRQEGWFEVIVGKSTAPHVDAKCFAFVNKNDAKPKRRLFEVLKSQGLSTNQQVTFLSDGGDTVREIPMYLSPESEHWLDWFHITMRLTVMGQMIKGLATEIEEAEKKTTKKKQTEDDDEDVGVDIELIEKRRESIKWNLWHGNVQRALQRLEFLQDDFEMISERFENGKKLFKAAQEFSHYILVNRAFIPNYGDRYRHGEAISTAFVESTVNQVVSKRMVKLQQMRWSERGAHLLLQVRAQALNGDLKDTFCRWYPGLRSNSEDGPKRKAA